MRRPTPSPRPRATPDPAPGAHVLWSRRRCLDALLCATTGAALASCGDADSSELAYHERPARPPRPQHRFAVHPLHNPRKLAAAYQPLLDHLNAALPQLGLELEASRDYRAYEAKYRQRGPHFLLPNPWHTLQALKAGYRVIAMAGDAEDFRGLFLVRQDSPLRRVEALRGRVVSYPSPTALAACVMPQYFLYQHGLDVLREVTHRYVGSQESAIMHAVLGQSDAAVTWPLPWRMFQREHPAEAAQLRVLAETPSLVNNSVMARDDLPVALSDALRDALLALDPTGNGREVLDAMAIARFHPADAQRYAPVARFIAEFERRVRPVEAA